MAITALIGCSDTPERRAPSAWPRTVDAAADTLLRLLSKRDRQALRQFQRSDLVSLHFELGMLVRNEFGLWSGNRELLASCGSSDQGAEDCSPIIIDRAWEKLQAPVR